MNVILYILIFCIGIVFGSFYTLAVYRIPKTEDITHTHSYCPNCGHKLGFWDLIPLLRYLFLGGKCRYCKEKIRPRYFIIELLSGLFFLSVAYLMGYNIQYLTIYDMINFAFLVLYFTFIILMAGIDKEERKIDKRVSTYGIIISLMYMVYLCVVYRVENISIVKSNSIIYRYAIYLLSYIIILIIDSITLKKTSKNYYINGIILTIITMAVFTEGVTALYTVLIVLISLLIYTFIKKLKSRKKEKIEIGRNLTLGYYLGISNISILLIVLIMNKFFV